MFTSNLHGHRKSYVEFVQKEFGAKVTKKKRHLFTHEPLLFLSIDDTFLLYCLMCFVRSSSPITAKTFPQLISKASRKAAVNAQNAVKNHPPITVTTPDTLNTALSLPQAPSARDVPMATMNVT